MDHSLDYLNLDATKLKTSVAKKKLLSNKVYSDINNLLESKEFIKIKNNYFKNKNDKNTIIFFLQIILTIFNKTDNNNYDSIDCIDMLNSLVINHDTRTKLIKMYLTQ